MFTIPRVARLADALVGPWGVLADSVNVAVVSPLHTLIHIWQGQSEYMRPSVGASQSVLKVVPQQQNPFSSKVEMVTLPEAGAQLCDFRNSERTPTSLKNTNPQ